MSIFTKEKKEITRVDLCPPWVEYYRKLEQLFAHDDEVEVELNEKARAITVKVSGNKRKGEALSMILREPSYVDVMIEYDDAEQRMIDYMADAFAGNDLFNCVKSVETPYGRFDYAEFKADVLQYVDDNIGTGYKTTSVEDIVKDVIDNEREDMVFVCSELLDKWREIE